MQNTHDTLHISSFEHFVKIKNKKKAKATMPKTHISKSALLHSMPDITPESYDVKTLRMNVDILNMIDEKLVQIITNKIMILKETHEVLKNKNAGAPSGVTYAHDKLEKSMMELIKDVSAVYKQFLKPESGEVMPSMRIYEFLKDDAEVGDLVKLQLNFRQITRKIMTLLRTPEAGSTLNHGAGGHVTDEDVRNADESISMLSSTVILDKFANYSLPSLVTIAKAVESGQTGDPKYWDSTEYKTSETTKVLINLKKLTAAEQKMNAHFDIFEKCACEIKDDGHGATWKCDCGDKCGAIADFPEADLIKVTECKAVGSTSAPGAEIEDAKGWFTTLKTTFSI